VARQNRLVDAIPSVYILGSQKRDLIMAKKQTFGQKSKKVVADTTMVKVIQSHKKESNGQYAFREKIVAIAEGQDISKAADALK
jgi:hypothetical protein